MALGFAPFGILATAFVGARALAGVTGRVTRALLNRGAVHRLAHLDDRALKDIGLTRSDVDGALAVPLLQDPSEMLVSRRRQGWPMAPVRPTAPQARPARVRAA